MYVNIVMGISSSGMSEDLLVVVVYFGKYIK